MRRLIVGDLHLDEKKDHNYRWLFFAWLRLIIHKLEIEQVDFLGDITEKKNNHSASLTNKVVDAFYDLSFHVNITITLGNHDYIDEKMPFFKFLDRNNGIEFIKCLSIVGDTIYIPHFFELTEDSKSFFKTHIFDYIFLHHSVVGAKHETGYPSENGIPRGYFEDIDCKGIFSGHEHISQDIGKVQFVGSPYSIKFITDKDHEYSIIYIDEKGNIKRLYYQHPKKVKVIISSEEELEDFKDNFSENDQLKFEVNLAPEERHRFFEIRTKLQEICEKSNFVYKGTQLGKISQKIKRIRRNPKRNTYRDHISVLKVFSKQEKLGSDLLDTGQQIIKGGLK